MDAVYTGEKIIMVAIEPSRQRIRKIIEKSPIQSTRENVTGTKRFGLVDLWKIHKGKRYIKVYSSWI